MKTPVVIASEAIQDTSKIERTEIEITKDTVVTNNVASGFPEASPWKGSLLPYLSGNPWLTFYSRRNSHKRQRTQHRRHIACYQRGDNSTFRHFIKYYKPCHSCENHYQIKGNIGKKLITVIFLASLSLLVAEILCRTLACIIHAQPKVITYPRYFEAPAPILI